MSTGGGCEAAVTARTRYEAAVTARTRCGWTKIRQVGELLYGRGFHLKLKWAVNRTVVLHGSEAWCLKESEI